MAATLANARAGASHKRTMTITPQYIKSQFELFNGQYFGSQLPLPRFEVSDARTYLGQFGFRRVRKAPLGQAKPTDFVIKISRHYDISERQVQNVLLHEMIHYYIAFKGIRDTSPHGQAFKSLMHTLNSRHGWDITVSSRRAPAKEGGRPTLRKRLVLAVTMNDGGHFLSVVNPAYRATLDSQARQESIIACHRWIESDDQFFHNFPTVRSLRGCKVDKATFDEKVAAGRPA